MIINIFLFLSVFFVLVFLFGKLFERWKVPWIFSSLFIGVILSIKNPFLQITSSSEFSFLSNLGMLFLLFIIGLEIDLKKFKKFAGFIVGATFFIILFETLVGGIIIHYLFGYGWFISFLVGISFATVGEAILIPILEEFKLVNTKFGQLLLGVGTFDDLFEISILVVLVLFLGIKSPLINHGDILSVSIALILVFVLASLFIKLKDKTRKFNYSKIETLFLLSIAILFLFVGIGEFSGSSALAALLAGVSLKTFLPRKRLEKIESEMKSLCYGLFAPIFFLSVGLAINMNYIFSSFWIILIIFFGTSAAKIIASYLVSSNKIGKKNSLLLGLGLSTRFSTSLVIIKILLDSGVVREGLYSAIVASSILFTLIIPILFSRLISKRGVESWK